MAASTPDELNAKMIFDNEVAKEAARREALALSLRHERDMEIAKRQDARDYKIICLILSFIVVVAALGVLSLYLSTDPKSKELTERFIVPVITALLGMLGGRAGKSNATATS